MTQRSPATRRKIAWLGAGSSIHTVRWTRALAERGHEVHLLSAHAFHPDLDPRVHRQPLPVPAPAGYLLNAFALRSALAVLGPDLLHAHYATGYGTLATLGGFHPRVLSVWGSDVFLFPERSALHRALVMRNLRGADAICSTSRAMAEHTHRLVPERPAPEVVPFGVDTDAFRPSSEPRDPGRLVVGTVKTLEARYGMDVLLDAFARVRQTLARDDPAAEARLHLRVVGEGSERAALARQARELGIEDRIELPGAVPHSEVPRALAGLDVYVAPSRSESFGVAVLEASACAVPVVVSDAGGLPEVVDDGRTGAIVPREDAGATAAAILALLVNPDLRRSQGEAGRAFVRERYEWGRCVSRLEEVYARLVGGSRS